MLAEKLLSRLSRDPGASDYDAGSARRDPERSLDLLGRVFPGFLHEIKGRRVLDFGCGDGYQSVALSQRGANYVLGVDSNLSALAKARQLAKELAPAANLEFVETLPPHLHGAFDIVISQNSFEHYGDPALSLEIMKRALNQQGLIFATFGPPWFAPYGSHMHFFTKVPWVNILFSDQTVMNVRKHFRSDGASRYEDVESGLNKMSVRRFEALVSASGLKAEKLSYDCVKGANFLGRLPVIRELFVNRINCVLRF